MPSVELQQVQKKDKNKLKKLWDLYSYDFSIYDNLDVDNDGSYDFYYQDSYFDSDTKKVYFIMCDGKHAGFLSVSDICYVLNRENDRCIVDFFVMNKYRKGGVGRKAATLLFDMTPSRWEVAQYLDNEVSCKFWKKIISEYTLNHYEERKVFTNNAELNVIVFNSYHNFEEETVVDINEVNNTHTMRLYSRVGDEIKHKLIEIADLCYGQQNSELLKNLRRDMTYQDLFTIEKDEDIEGFFLFTSINGDAHITYIAINPKLQHKELGTWLLKEFKQFIKLQGFDTIIIEIDNIKYSKSSEPVCKFFIKNDFKVKHSNEFMIFLECNV